MLKAWLSDWFRNGSLSQVHGDPDGPDLTGVDRYPSKPLPDPTCSAQPTVWPVIKGSPSVLVCIVSDHIESSFLFYAFLSLASFLFQVVLTEKKVTVIVKTALGILSNGQERNESSECVPPNGRNRQMAHYLCHVPVPGARQRAKPVLISVSSLGACDLPLNLRISRLSLRRVARKLKGKNSDWRLMWFFMLFNGMYFANEFP